MFPVSRQPSFTSPFSCPVINALNSSLYKYDVISLSSMFFNTFMHGLAFVFASKNHSLRTIPKPDCVVHASRVKKFSYFRSPLSHFCRVLPNYFTRHQISLRYIVIALHECTGQFQYRTCHTDHYIAVTYALVCASFRTALSSDSNFRQARRDLVHHGTGYAINGASCVCV